MKNGEYLKWKMSQSGQKFKGYMCIDLGCYFYFNFCLCNLNIETRVMIRIQSRLSKFNRNLYMIILWQSPSVVLGTVTRNKIFITSKTGASVDLNITSREPKTHQDAIFNLGQYQSASPVKNWGLQMSGV